MNYEILLANGEQLIKRKACGVTKINIVSEVYVFSDTTGAVVFSAPVNSVVCVEQI